MKPQTARTAAVLVLAAAAVYLLHGLVVPIAWAGLIAMATWPLHDWLRQRLGARFQIASALVLTGAVILFLVVPLAYIAVRAWHELPAMIQLWSKGREAGLQAPAWLAQFPGVGGWAAAQWNDSLGAPGALSDQLRSISGGVGMARGRTLVLLLGHDAMAFFFCVVVLFFLYLDGDAFAEQIDAVLSDRLGPAGRRIRGVVVTSARGAVNGLVLVGVGVAVTMTIAYAVAGVPHPFALGLATGLLGMVPFGAMVVLAAVVLYLGTSAAWSTAIWLGVLGAVAIFIADHFVRPVFMAGAARLPVVLALLGIIGGLETLGVLGLFVGPTLLAVVAAVWRDLAAAGSVSRTQRDPRVQLTDSN